MDASFIPVEVTPSKTPFGLDQLRRSYKTALSAEDAIAAAPAVGTADEAFPNMFLMPISTPETAESATRIDLLYLGCMAGAGGSPTLPAQKHDNDTAVQSATSSYGISGPAIQPITIQFYAPANTLSYFSFGAAGTTDADDPTSDPVVISITLGSTTYTPGSLPDTVANFFGTQIVATIASQEMVPGQYWQNVARKTKAYIPVMFSFTPGSTIVTLGAPGSGYAVGNTLTVTVGGESATLTVTALGINQSILSFNVTANTFTAAHNLVSGSGGSGSGALFNVIVI